MSNPAYPRLLRPPRGSFFLFGVRGVGKSTWSRTVFSDAHRIDLLDEGLYHALLADPSRFASELRALPKRSLVVVDEVQRLPGLLNEVHRFIEERDLRFVLLGSSARKLKTAGTNLLAGRAAWKTMLPLTPEEMGDDFDLSEALRWGTIPVIHAAAERDDALQAYVRLYLKEEVRAEALVRSLPSFARFLPVAALFHGQAINVSGLARDAGVARTTVHGYLEILEDTLVATRLPAFEGKLRVRERRHPKLYWVDPGLVRELLRRRGPVAAEESGPLLEGWAHSLLRVYAEQRELYEDVSYWSPAEALRVEVDFVLRKGREFLALEVKAARQFTPALAAGLDAIADLPRLVRRVLVYRGDRVLKTKNGVDVWPVERFLRALAGDSLWP